YTWAINNYFTWVVGASYDYNKIKKAEYRNQAQTAVEGEWEKYNASAFNPQTILYFTPFNGTNFYASVSQRTNFPTLKDRYSTRFGQYEPNPDLSEEKATNYEIGVSQLIANNTLLKFALFHTKTKDYITQIRTSSSLNKNVNVGKEEQTGAEFSVDSQILDNLSVFGNYTYMHARIKDDDENKYIVGVPEHSLFAGLIYSPIKQINIIPQVRYESKRYASSAISDKDFVNKSYTLADIKIAYRPIDDFELNFRVNNIFDEDYSYAYGYPAQGRNYYAGFKYSF
ncbi:MAG: TonB-dependent receptor, partial [Campylobacter sp.]|nr:TonB-dependent receptor [Campylobacter sp.]